jgi:hypothetical protein
MVSRRAQADARLEFARPAVQAGDPSGPVGDRGRKERAGSSARPALSRPAPAGWSKRGPDLRLRASEEAGGLIGVGRESVTRRRLLGTRPVDRQSGKARQERGGRATRAGNGERPFAAPGSFPAEHQIVCRRAGNIHFGGAVARATELIPCSSARFATSTTRE